MATGKVLWFNDAKGYGWIEDNSGTRYFARAEELSSAKLLKLQPGQKVEFQKSKIPSSVPAMGVEMAASKIRVIEK